MTGGNNTTTSGGATSRGVRAVDAALSAKTPFRSRVGAAAMRASTRHVERWAPEGPAAKRSRSLGALAFADNVLTPFVERAGRAARTEMFGSGLGPMNNDPYTGMAEREVEATSWIFPRPWYLDELAWLASARATSSMSGSFGSATRARQESGVSNPPLPLAFVAPSYAGPMGGGGRSSLASVSTSASDRSTRRSGTGARSGAVFPDSTTRRVSPQQRRASSPSALRAWSPLVSFPAAQAAEVMQAVAGSPQSIDRTVGTLTDEAWALFEYVAPTDLSKREQGMHVSQRARGRIQKAAELAAQRRDVSLSAGTVARPSAATPAPIGVHTLSSQASQTSGQSLARAGEIRSLGERPASVAESRANAPVASQPDGVPTRPVSSGVAAPSSDIRATMTPVSAMSGIELLRRAVTSGGAALEPVSGPRIALPSGLGGAVLGLQTARALARPLSQARRYAGMTPTRMAPSRSAAFDAQKGDGPVREGSVRGSIAYPETATAYPGTTASAAAGGGAERTGSLGGRTLAAARQTGESFPLPGIGPEASSGRFDIGSAATSAFRAIVSTRPRSMQHVAWSDRWLARFAGASPATLARLDATTGAAPLETLSYAGLAAGAPSPVFIAGDIVSAAARNSEPSRRLLMSAIRSDARRTAFDASSVQDVSRTVSAPVPVFTAPHIVMRSAAAEAHASSLPSDRMTSTTRSASAAAATPAGSLAQGRAATSTAAPGMTARAAPVIGDDESVSDEVFAAIAGASATPASRDARRLAASSRQSRDELASQREQERRARIVRTQTRPTHEDAAQTASSPFAARTTHSRAFVDRLLDFGPTAPGPGMRTALAASPIAPALHAVLPMPAAPSFDMRSVSGDGLAYVYLLGAVEPEMRFVGSTANAAMVGALFGSPESASPGARMSLIEQFASRAGALGGATSTLDGLARSAPQATFVAPFATSHAASSGRGSTALDVVSPLFPTAETRALQLGALSSMSRTASVAAAASSSIPAATWSANTAQAMATLSGGSGYAYGPGQAGIRAQEWSVAQERSSTDLAFDFVPPELIVAARVYGFGPAEAAQAARLSVAGQSGLASLASAVDLSFIDTFQNVQAQRAGGIYEARRERSAEQPIMRATGADNRSVFAPTVSAGRSPESRVRDRVGRPMSEPAGSLAATGAATGSVVPGMSVSGGESAAHVQNRVSRDDAGASAAGSSEALFRGAAGHRPRGAFLWPQAAVAALGMDGGFGLEGDGQSVSLAALDLLAAKAVADVGVFVAPDGTPMSVAANDSVMSLSADRHRTPDVGRILADLVGADAANFRGAGANLAGSGAIDQPLVSTIAPDFRQSEPGVTQGVAPSDVGREARAATTESALPAKAGSMAAGPLVDGSVFSDPSEAAAVVSAVGSTRIPREFQALYVALSRSPAGRSMSPAVRAARALALSRTIDTGNSSVARARAAAAWAVIPMVISGELPFVELSAAVASAATEGQGDLGLGDSSGIRPSDSRPVGAQRPDAAGNVYVAGGRITASGAALGDSRDSERNAAVGRAGESLRSLVTPHSEHQQGKAFQTRSNSGAMGRTPTAAQPLVQTGSSAALHPVQGEMAAMRQMIAASRTKQASGDVAIPNWFEKAAQQMFRSSGGNGGGGVSFAEMTLVAAAPASQVAASPKTANASVTSAPQSPGGAENEGAQAAPDVEAMALEVYAEICRLMEISRERNGEPWR